MTKLEDKYWRKICLQQNEIDKYLNEKIELQDRIDTAIEYIKNNIDYSHIDLTIDGVVEDLLEILGDKENENN